LLDVILRGGKPADETEAGQDKPPAVEQQAPAARLLPGEGHGNREASDADIRLPNSDEFSYGLVRSGSRRTSELSREHLNSGESSYDLSGSGSRKTSGAGLQSPNSHELSYDGENAADAGWAALGRRSTAWMLAGGALASCAAAGDWSERIDTLLSRVKPDSLSKASRLARKFRRVIRGT